MYSLLLHLHSLLRFFILIALLIVIVKAVMGMTNKTPFGKWDNKFSLYLLIFTHLQLIIGVILYFISPQVWFDGSTMSDKVARYWAVEHVVGMLIAVILITVARITSKRFANDHEKHKRLFIFNLIALAIVVIIIGLGDRGLFSMTVN